MKSRSSIIVTDLILIAGLVLCLFSNKEINPNTAWQSFHCIIGAAWLALMTLHIGQHWKLTKAFRTPKVRLRNKLTTLTIAVFIVLFFSIAVLAATTTPVAIHFHRVFVHLFMGVVIIHLLTKSKRMLILIREERKKPAGL